MSQMLDRTKLIKLRDPTKNLFDATALRTKLTQKT